MSLLRAVETTLHASGGVGDVLDGLDGLHLVERADGSVEVWPEAPSEPTTVRSVGRRRVALAHCLSSLQSSGHQVELVCRGETFVRCRA